MSVTNVRNKMLTFAKSLLDFMVDEMNGGPSSTPEDQKLYDACYVSIASIYNFANEMNWKEITEEIEPWFDSSIFKKAHQKAVEKNNFQFESIGGDSE